MCQIGYRCLSWIQCYTKVTLRMDLDGGMEHRFNKLANSLSLGRSVE